MALCCACSRILAPPSGVVGSIGTISTMVSQAGADKQMGLDFRIITSGKRKADGHPHQPITDDAVKAETARNAQLAAQFFALAGKARKIAPAKLESLEASIYLAKDAARLGLIDEVISLDEAIYGLDKSETPPPAPAPNTGNVTDRRAAP
jgi:ClpP class serine protease